MRRRRHGVRSVFLSTASAGGGGGAMARSRRVLDKSTLLVAVLVVAALGVVTGQVALSNGIIGERAAISDLRADRAYLQARLGLLERDWNRQTSRDVIVERAMDLGLRPPTQPSLLLVLDDAPRRDGPSFLRRAMVAVGAREAHAAVGGDGP